MLLLFNSLVFRAKIVCFDAGPQCTWILHFHALQDANDEYKMLTDPAMDNVTGQYRVSHRPRSMARAVEDKAARDRLWKTLEEQTGAQWPQRH